MLRRSEVKSLTAIGQDIPACLCHQVMHRKPDRPALRHASSRNEYIIWCPTCGYQTHPDKNRQSVITEWYLSNQPGNKHIEKIWFKRYLELKEGATMVAQDNEEHTI